MGQKDLSRNLIPVIALAVGLAVMLYAGWRSTTTLEHEARRLAELESRRALLESASFFTERGVVLVLRRALDRPMHAEESSMLAQVLDCVEEQACTEEQRLRRISAAHGFFQAAVAAQQNQLASGRFFNQWLLVLGAFLALASLGRQAARLAQRASRVRQREERLDDVNQLLERRLEEVYALRMSAAEANRFAAYGELAAGFSHRLKTPLAGMRMAAQLAQRKLGGASPAQGQLTDIIEEVDKLLDEVQRFLTATRTGELVQTRLRLDSFLAGLTDEYGKVATGGGVRYEVRVHDDTPEVQVDAALLEMGLRNLIENALAVAPSGTVVQVNARPTEAPARAGVDQAPPREREGWVAIDVVDKGPGIDPAVLGADQPTSTKPHGSGLGMAIARRIAARHGGTMLIDTGASGTKVSLVLPSLGATA